MWFPAFCPSTGYKSNLLRKSPKATSELAHRTNTPKDAPTPWKRLNFPLGCLTRDVPSIITE